MRDDGAILAPVPLLKDSVCFENRRPGEHGRVLWQPAIGPQTHPPGKRSIPPTCKPELRHEQGTPVGATARRTDRKYCKFALRERTGSGFASCPGGTSGLAKGGHCTGCDGGDEIQSESSILPVNRFALPV